METRKLEKVTSEYEMLKFANVSELVDAAANGTPPEESQYFYDEQKAQCNNFTNHYNLARVQEELTKPPASSVRMRELVKEIEGSYEFTTTRRKMTHRRECGDELDEVSWIRRELDGWRRVERVSTPSTVVRIGVNLSVNCSMNPSDLYYRGAAAVALADVIEASGSSVEIVAFDCGKKFRYDYYGTSVFELIVKRPDSPVDIDTLSLVCAEIGFFRTAMLCAMITGSPTKVKSGLGTPCRLPQDELENFDVFLDIDITDKASAIEAISAYAKGLETADI